MTEEQALWGLVLQGREGILATLYADGRPQLTNVLCLADPESRTIRISTTASRAKARNLRRDPRAALHVMGGDHWEYAVAEGEVTLSEVAVSPEDDAVAELREITTAFYGPAADDDAFAAQMVANGRLVVRLHVSRLYGVIAAGGRRPIPRASRRG